MNAKRNYDAKTIHGRAARLLARHTQMGFKKDGKPIVIDQAFELVAAEEGYRNQHELRASVSKHNGVSAAAEVFASGIEAAGYVDKTGGSAQSENEGQRLWHDVCNRMGWNEESQLVHLEGFLAEKGLMAAFAAYAQTAAREEEGFVDDVLPELEDALWDVGYSVQNSEFGKPYWSLEEPEEVSTDFRNETAAWDDALNHAVGRLLAKTGMTRANWDALSLAARMKAIGEHLGDADDSGEAAMYAAANEAYENYNFGEHMTVAGDDGWLNSGSGILSRTVYLEDDRNLAADSVRYKFAVEVVNGKVVSTNVTKL